MHILQKPFLLQGKRQHATRDPQIPNWTLKKRMNMVSSIPRKHAHSLRRLHSLALSFGTYYRGLRRPLHQQSCQSLPFLPTVWADFEALHTQKTKLPRLTTVCLGKPDTMLSWFVCTQEMKAFPDSIVNSSHSLITTCRWPSTPRMLPPQELCQLLYRWENWSVCR